MAASFHLLHSGEGELVMVDTGARARACTCYPDAETLAVGKLPVLPKAEPMHRWIEASALAILLAVAGCGNKSSGAKDAEGEENPNRVPRAAQLVNSGKGNMAHFADGPGTVYVVDGESKRVVYSSRMGIGDKLMMHLRSGQIALNGKMVSGIRLNPDHAHRIYFLRG